MSLNIEHKVFGSLTNEQGDGVLSYTGGVSSSADSLGRLLTSTPQQPLSDKYASLYFLPNPENGLLTFLHVQGRFTVFSGMARAYDTRAIYEIQQQQFLESGASFAAVVKVLNGMRPYSERVFGATNNVSIQPSNTNEPSELNDKLVSALIYCLVHNKQLFIHLGEDEDLQGDNIRKSWRLAILLRAFDSLPQSIRPYLSMGFSLDSKSMATRALADHLLVVAHHDDIANWGSASQTAFTIDWTNQEPVFVNTQACTQNDIKCLTEVAPLIKDFLGKNPPIRSSICSMFSLIPHNVDELISRGKSTPTENDKLILNAVYDGGKECYRHADVAKKMFFFITHGSSFGTERMPQLVRDYPELRSNPDLESYLSVYIKNRGLTCPQLCDIYDKYSEVPCIKSKLINHIKGYSVLLNAMPQVAGTKMGIALQPDIQRIVKETRNEWKVEHIDEPYFGLSVEDIKITDWSIYAKIAGSLSKKPNGAERVRQIKVQAKEWGVNRLTINVFNAIKPLLKTSDILTILQSAQKDPSPLYCEIMDNILGNGEGNPSSFIFKESPLYRQEYLVKNCKGKMLSAQRSIVFGEDYAILDTHLIEMFFKLGHMKQAGFIEDVLRFYKDKGRLGSSERLKFIECLDMSATHLTWVTYTKNLIKVYAYLPEYFSEKRLKNVSQLGDTKQYVSLKSQLQKATLPEDAKEKLLGLGQELLLDGCPQDFEQLIKELKVTPLVEEHFVCFESANDILLLCPEMTFDQFGKLYKSVAKNTGLKEIGKQGLFEEAMSQYAVDLLPKWFNTKDVTKSLYFKAVSEKGLTSPLLYVLSQMSKLSKAELIAIKDPINTYYSKTRKKNDADAKRRLQPALNNLVEALRKQNLLDDKADEALISHATKAHLKNAHPIKIRQLKRVLILGLALTLILVVVIAIWHSRTPDKKETSPKQSNTTSTEPAPIDTLPNDDTLKVEDTKESPTPTKPTEDVQSPSEQTASSTPKK